MMCSRNNQKVAALEEEVAELKLAILGAGLELAKREKVIEELQGIGHRLLLFVQKF